MPKNKNKGNITTDNIPDVNVNTYDDVITESNIEDIFDSNNEVDVNNDDTNNDDNSSQDANNVKDIDDSSPKETTTPNVAQKTNEPEVTENKPDETDKIRLSDFEELINQAKEDEVNDEKRNKEKTADVSKGNEKQQERQKVQQQRDYSIFNEEEQKLFKGTSNEVYEYLKSTLPKLRELEKHYKELEEKQQQQQQQQQVNTAIKQPTTIYDHPESYVLSDEYRNNAYKAQLYDFEERHWTEQLQRLRSSENKLVDLIGYDEKGNPKFAEIEIKPEMVSKAEVQLIKNIQSATSAKQNAINDLNKYAETHKKTYSDSVSSIKELENKFLSMYNEKSHRAKDIQTFVNNIPPTFRNDPLLSPMSKMYAMILDLIDIVKKNKTTNQSNNVDEDIKKKTQPTSNTLKVGGGTNEILYSPDEYADEI